jgi:inosine-uridine nucleoside N-ribohydrolase/ribosomal protein S11
VTSQLVFHRPRLLVFRMLTTGLVVGLLAAVVSVVSAPRVALAASGSSATPVIIDTDIYSNSDDAGALAAAFALDLKGVVKVIAIGVDTRTSRPAVAKNSWKCVAAIARFYGFGDIPIGSDMPDNGTTVSSPDMVGPCAALASPTTPAPASAVSVYRRALASQPNGSVEVVGSGYEENLAALLTSPPDAISPLTGAQLVAQKVSSLVVTGGGYPSRTSENNFGGNPAAAEYVAANWPTKVVYSGYEVGVGVFAGHTLSTVHPASSPVRVAYEVEVGVSKNNRSWDLTTLYHAAIPSDPLLTEVGPGTNVVNGTGGNVFTPGTGNGYYLSLSNATQLGSTLEKLLDVLPGNAPQAVAFTSPPGSPQVGGTYTATATGGATGNPVTFWIDPSSTSGCTVNGTTGQVSFSGPAGTCVVDAYQDGSLAYAAGQAQQTITVAPASQTISFTSTTPASPVVGGTYQVTATGGGSVNPVILTIDGSSTGGCTINAATGLVTLSGPAGTCVIDANQVGNTSYLPALTAQQALSVAPAPQSLTITSTPPASPQIGGTYAVTTAAGASGSPVTYSIDASSTSGCSVDAASGLVSFAGPVGSCVVDANQAGNTSYLDAPQAQQSMTVAHGSQTIVITSTPPASPTIGGSYTVVASGGASGSPLAFSIDPASTSGCTVDPVSGLVSLDAPTGTCVVDVNQAGTADYLSAPQVQQSVEVGEGVQTISFTSTPPASAIVGGTYAVSASGGPSGYPVTFSIDASSTSGCTLDASTDVVDFTGGAGSCVLDANQAGSASYLAAPQVQQVVTVAKAPQAITFTATPPAGSTFGGGYTATTTGGASGNPVTYSIDASSTAGCTVDAASGAVAFVGAAGTCLVDANQAGNASYLDAPQVQQVVTIAKAPQAIVFTSTPPSMPEANDAYTVSVTGGASANAVVLTVDPSSTSGCTVNGTTGAVSLGGPAGSCVIDANQAGNSSYLAAPRVQQLTVSIRVPVIIDTDIYSNSDDVGALANAFALDLQGTTNVVAVGVNTRLSRPAVAINSWRCVAAIAQFYGFGNVPIGSDMPDIGTTVASPDMVGPCAALASPSTPAPASAVSVYRQALVSQPNGSVEMVGTGYDENLAALLASPPDAISPLTGAQLVAQKVRSLVLMGGGYPSRAGENNFDGNPAAAEYVAANWPTKIVYSGYEVGYGVFAGHTLSTVHPVSSPVRVAYEAEVGVSKNNRSWDLTALYHAVYPNDPLLTEVGPGTNAVDSSGGNVFTPGTGDQYYLSLSNATQLGSTLEKLLDVLPGSAPQTVTFTSSPGSLQVGGTYTATATGGATRNPVTFWIDPSSTSGCTVNGTTGQVSFAAPAGTCVVDAYQDGSLAYAAGQAQQTITVAKLPQSVAFTSTPPASPVVGSSYGVAATATSQLAAAFTVDPASTAVCGVSGATVTLHAAGTCTIDANQPGDPTYLAAPQVQQSVAVGPGPQAITFISTPPSSPKAGGTYAVSAASSSGLFVTLSVDASASAVCSISGGTLTFLAIGTCRVDANQAGNVNYFAAPQVQQSMTVGKGAQTISFTSTPPVLTKRGGTYAVSATASSHLGVTITIDRFARGICTISGSTVTFLALGTCVIDANQTGNASFSAAPQVQQSFQIGTQIITFTSTTPSTPKVSGTYQVTAVSTSNLVVTLTIDRSTRRACSLRGNTVTFLTSGACTIDANQAGNASYQPATQVHQTVTVP